VARASLAARPATITAPSTSRPAAELFATAYYNRGLGSVRDFKYDSTGRRVGVIVGLNWVF
jgi:hypothetical protein